jgi:hypothetical protein
MSDLRKMSGHRFARCGKFPEFSGLLPALYRQIAHHSGQPSWIQGIADRRAER